MGGHLSLASIGSLHRGGHRGQHSSRVGSRTLLGLRPGLHPVTKPVSGAAILALVQVSLHIPAAGESLAAAGTLVSAPVYVSVVLETAGVFEQFAALVAAVASGSSTGVKSLAHTV